MSNFKTIWRPAAYHGRGKRPTYFEGWYFKMVDAACRHRYAVIPGIYRHPDPAKSYAFVQTLDGRTAEAHMHRYPVDAFSASEETLDVRVGPNRFCADSLQLAIDRPEQQVHGELNFEGLQPWPVRTLSPGAMGWYAFVPFMQTYHGILSFDHHIGGALAVDESRLDFTGGRGYIEKDWGQTFPRAYVWMQTNHFTASPGTSLSGSVATIPWLTGWFRGVLLGLWHQGELYRFTTYTGARTTRLHITDTHVVWHVEGSGRGAPRGRSDHRRYRLEINARRSEGGLLSAPELEGMVARINESLDARIEVRLFELDAGGEEVIFSGTGQAAGLEVAGSVEELLEG